jgi:outer membrane murein-binding lipoprotein Lpp
MHNFILQLQLLLAALSALLPLAPNGYRVRIAEVLSAVAKALAAGAAVSTNVDDLAAKLAALRAEVEQIAESGRAISETEFDVAMARVGAASAAFRSALEQR